MKRVYWFIRKLFKRLSMIELSMLAAQCSFFIILAFFPFLLFMLTLINKTHIDSGLFINVVKIMLPENIYILVHNIMENAKEQSNIFYSISGIIATIWVSSRAVVALNVGINRLYPDIKPRLWYRRLLLSIFQTLVFIATILSSLILIIFGERIGSIVVRYFGAAKPILLIWDYMRYEITVLFLLMTLILIYKSMPNIKLTFKQVFPGAIIASVLWIIMTSVFSYFINNFFMFSKIYGGIGGIILMLFWLKWAMHVIFFGAAINSVLYDSKKE